MLVSLPTCLLKNPYRLTDSFFFKSVAMPEFRAGQIIPLRYKSQEVKAIIIDPNGLGPDCTNSWSG